MDINVHTIHIMQHTTIPTAYRIARLCQFRRETSFLHFKKSGKEGIRNSLHFYKLTLNRQKATTTNTLKWRLEIEVVSKCTNLSLIWVPSRLMHPTSFAVLYTWVQGSHLVLHCWYNGYHFHSTPYIVTLPTPSLIQLQNINTVW